MAACKFRVIAVSVEPNLRGQAMRRVRLVAVDSDPFRSPDTLADGVRPADADGAITLLVHEAYARRFALDDEFDVMFRERE